MAGACKYAQNDSSARRWYPFFLQIASWNLCAALRRGRRIRRARRCARNNWPQVVLRAVAAAVACAAGTAISFARSQRKPPPACSAICWPHLPQLLCRRRALTNWRGSGREAARHSGACRVQQSRPRRFAALRLSRRRVPRERAGRKSGAHSRRRRWSFAATAPFILRRFSLMPLCSPPHNAAQKAASQRRAEAGERRAGAGKGTRSGCCAPSSSQMLASFKCRGLRAAPAAFIVAGSRKLFARLRQVSEMRPSGAGLVR